MSSSAKPCSSPEASQFDFWIGEWDLSWPAEQTGGAAGEPATGTNRVEYALDGCVVAEHFETSEGGFRGRSWSVLDPTTGSWRQTWVDSGGGYLLFTGRFDGETMELRSGPTERDGVTFINRMVFRDIEAEALRWDWQRSDDEGANWTDLWTITYQRRQRPRNR